MMYQRRQHSPRKFVQARQYLVGTVIAAAVLIPSGVASAASNHHRSPSPDQIAKSIETRLGGCWRLAVGNREGAYEQATWDPTGIQSNRDGSANRQGRGCANGSHVAGGTDVANLLWYHSRSAARQAAVCDDCGLTYYTDGDLGLVLTEQATRAQRAAVARIRGLHRVSISSAE